MSVQEIARRAGLSRAHVHRIAAGEVRRPSYDTVQRLKTLREMVTKAAPPPKP